MIERWEEFRPGYSVSSLGRIRNDKNGNMRVLSIRRRYLSVYIRDKNYPAHRLVAQYFVPNPNLYDIVNHKDGNVFNNNCDNLEWCTVKQNVEHSMKRGTHTAVNKSAGGRLGNNKPQQKLRPSKLGLKGIKEVITKHSGVKYHVTISIGGGRTGFVGSYATLPEAKEAYAVAFREKYE